MVVRSRVQKGTRWNIRQPDPDIVSHLCESGGFTSMISSVLVNRGYFDIDSVGILNRDILGVITSFPP